MSSDDFITQPMIIDLTTTTTVPMVAVQEEILLGPQKSKLTKVPKIVKLKQLPKAPPPEGYCVCGIDIGLKNFSLCIMRQAEIDPDTQSPNRPKILEWRNTNLYSDRTGGKILKHEAADKLIHRLESHLDEVGKCANDWKDVNEVNIESQAASTNSIRRVEAMVFAYFYFKHPHLQVKTISASRKLTLAGMNHSKEDCVTYKARKDLAVYYARRFMEHAPPDCPFKHTLDALPRKKKGEIRVETGKVDDKSDSILTALYVLKVSV